MLSYVQEKLGGTNNSGPVALLYLFYWGSLLLSRGLGRCGGWMGERWPEELSGGVVLL